MSKRQKAHNDATSRVMNRIAKVRGKTGHLVDWQKVDEAVVSDPFDIGGLFKRVFNILFGKHNETKHKA